MKTTNINLTTFIIISVLFFFCSCNKSNVIKEYAEKLTEKCPIVVNEAMTITGATYDEDQLTFKILLDEGIINMSAIKSDDYKSLVAISMANKGIFTNELIENDICVVYSFKGNKTGTKHNIIVTPEEMQEMSTGNIDINKIYNIMLTSSTNIAKEELPYEVGKGIKLSNIELNDTSLVYVYEVSENLYEISKLESLEIRQEQKDILKYSDDISTATEIRLLIATKKSLVYKYVGDKSKNEYKMVFSPSELKQMVIRE